MLPSDLKADSFKSYPPEARTLAVDNLTALQRLPLSFLPGLLREVIEYDYKFPAERRSLDKEVANLKSLSPDQTKDWFQAFAQIRLSSSLERFDWVNSPAQFVEQLSAHLWTTHQLDAFRAAAIAYADRLRAAVPAEPPPPVPRLGIAVVGQGVAEYKEPLFRKLRPHGAYFTQIQPENGLPQLLEAVAARAKAHPAPYAHWYIDGGEEVPHDPALTLVSYRALEPARSALLAKMQAEVAKPGMGPEALRTMMAQIHPADLGLSKAGDQVLDPFQVKLLTEGSGTQIFSTSFAQWAAREALRRAQPLTLLVRFAPRQRQKPMNEMLFARVETVELDPVGSLVDGDMGAYYNWINQQRLPGADQSRFLVWFEGHNLAVAVSPKLPRNTESTTAANLRDVLALMA
jgi:hypothetical protein